MFDWANNWQGKIRETGSSGLNIRVGNQYTSMLRSEAGLRFYETIRYGVIRCSQPLAGCRNRITRKFPLWSS